MPHLKALNIKYFSYCIPHNEKRKKFTILNKTRIKKLYEYLSVCKEYKIQAKNIKNGLLLFPIIKDMNGRTTPIKIPFNGRLFPIKIKIKDITIVILHLLLYSYANSINQIIIFNHIRNS